MGKRKYVWLHGKEIYVSDEVYNEYYRSIWREEKYDAVWDDRQYSLDELFDKGFEAVSDEKLVDEIVSDKILLDELFSALAELTNDERSLIHALFFEEKSERILSTETGIPQKTINNRKRAILKKLRKFFK